MLAGKNDGLYDGKRFFKCPNPHGIFVPIHHIHLLASHKKLKNVSQLTILCCEKWIRECFFFFQLTRFVQGTIIVLLFFSLWVRSSIEGLKWLEQKKSDSIKSSSSSLKLGASSVPNLRTQQKIKLFKSQKSTPALASTASDKKVYMDVCSENWCTGPTIANVPLWMSNTCMLSSYS